MKNVRYKYSSDEISEVVYRIKNLLGDNLLNVGFKEHVHSPIIRLDINRVKNELIGDIDFKKPGSYSCLIIRLIIICSSEPLKNTI